MKPSVNTTLWSHAYTLVKRSKMLNGLMVVAITLSCVYPTDHQLAQTLALPANDSRLHGVLLVENYLRFIPTVLQVALPVVLADKIGLIQLVYLGVATTVATHGGKRLLNDQWVMGTRLGERPNNGKHNMPSGHSSMSACAVYFIARRYSLWLGLALIPVLLLTMYARVALNDHTVSAVIAGCLVGFLGAAWFTSHSSIGRLLHAKQRRKVAQPRV